MGRYGYYIVGRLRAAEMETGGMMAVKRIGLGFTLLTVLLTITVPVTALAAQTITLSLQQDLSSKLPTRQN